MSASGSRRLPFQPGSLPWLLAHQLRMQLRAVQRGRSPWVMRLFLVLVLLAVAATTGVAIAMMFRGLGDDRTALFVPLGAMLVAVSVSGASVNVMAAFATLTDRDDLDLLLSAPVPPHRVAVVRLLAGAIRQALLYLLFAGMLLGVSVVLVSPSFLSVVLVVAGFALAESGIGFLLARALMLRLGVRAGRTVTQGLGMLGLLVGVLGYQAMNQMAAAGLHGGDGAERVRMHDLMETLAPLGWLGRAVLGDFVAAACILAGGAAVFAAVAGITAGRFATDVARLQAQDGPAASRPVARPVRLTGGWLASGLRKEWRSMLRDPQMLSQIAIPLVALVPACLALVRAVEDKGPFVSATLAGIGVLVVAQIVASLAWVCASVEEAGDLIRAAPLHPGRGLLVKLVAVAGPGLILVLLYAVPVALFSPLAGLWTVGVGLVTCCAATAVEFWRPRPARRARMTERPDRSMISVLLGGAIGLCGAVAAGLGAAGLATWGLVPAVAGALLVWLARITAPASASHSGTGPLPPASGPWSALASSAPAAPSARHEP